MGVLTHFLQLHSFVAGFTRILSSVFMTVHCLFTLLVHAETVGSIRTHRALPVYRPFIALLFETVYFRLCYCTKG